MAGAWAYQWHIIAMLIVLWLGIALHTGLTMRRYGRRWWVWFILSAFLTVIPAVVVSYLEHFRALRRYHDQIAARARRHGDE